jgi:hypothetical protein
MAGRIKFGTDNEAEVCALSAHNVEMESRDRAHYTGQFNSPIIYYTFPHLFHFIHISY